jgi:PhnB protein
MKLAFYLFLDGRADEALEFYAAALGGTIEDRMRFSDSPDPVPVEYLPPGGADKLMHGSLRIDDQLLMVSDGACPGTEGGRHAGTAGFSATAGFPTKDEAQRAWDALVDGGQVLMPIGPTFFSPHYGQLVDRFGIQWMVMQDAAGA